MDVPETPVIVAEHLANVQQIMNQSSDNFDVDIFIQVVNYLENQSA